MDDEADRADQADDLAAWDGVERRHDPQPLAASTLEVLTKTHEAIAGVAEAMRDLGHDLVESQKRQSRGIKVLVIIAVVASVSALLVSIATLIFAIYAVRQSNDNYEKLAYIATCVEVDGECFDRIEERERVVTDADRKLLAQEIICYVTGQCPPGMDRDNIPDLEDLPPPTGP